MKLVYSSGYHVIEDEMRAFPFLRIINMVELYFGALMQERHKSSELRLS